MTDKQVIAALGNIATLSVRLDMSRSTIANWAERGIPWRYRPVLKEMARRNRVKLPADFLTVQRARAS